MILSSNDSPNGQIILPKDNPKQPKKSSIPKPATVAITSLEQEDDTTNESQKLRPSKLDDLIGQHNIVKQLKLIIDSCLIRQKMPEHILFYGQPGLGKTTLASLIASEVHAKFKLITAPSLQKVGDIVGILLSLEPNTVLFIDEIHRLKAPLEETLYSAMEDNRVDIVMGKGNGANTLSMEVHPFVLVGATTQLGKLSKPLKDRFPTIFQLESYNFSDMTMLINRSCAIIGLKLTDKAIAIVCDRCRGVPRIANNILKRLLDFQIVSNISELDVDVVGSFFEDLGIHGGGLTRSDIAYLQSLQNNSLGLKTLASILQEDSDTVELVIEPYLLHLGLIDKTISGRSLTTKGKQLVIKMS